MSRPIVVIVCMLGSSESWEHYQRPHPWHSCAGGGAVHSIRSRHGTSRIRGHQFGGEAFHHLTLSSHNTSSCNRVWETWAIIVVRQRMPASVLTAGRAQLAVVGLFGPRRVRTRTVAASPYRPR